MYRQEATMIQQNNIEAYIEPCVFPSGTCLHHIFMMRTWNTPIVNRSLSKLKSRPATKTTLRRTYVTSAPMKIPNVLLGDFTSFPLCCPHLSLMIPQCCEVAHPDHITLKPFFRSRAKKLCSVYIRVNIGERCCRQYWTNKLFASSGTQHLNIQGPFPIDRESAFLRDLLLLTEEFIFDVQGSRIA